MYNPLPNLPHTTIYLYNPEYPSYYLGYPVSKFKILNNFFHNFKFLKLIFGVSSTPLILSWHLGFPITASIIFLFQIKI